jgi:hypothetical protein
MSVLKTEADRTRWVAFVQAQALPLTVDCSPWKPTRSNEQNALLFGVLYPPIAEAMGYTVDDVHEYMCGRFFGWTDVKVPKTPRNPEGIASEPIRSTTRTGWHSGKRDVIDKATFARFLETVDRIAAQAGVFIPDMGVAA